MALIEAVRGGRVAHSGFLAEADSARCAAQLRAEGVAYAVDGGYPGAARRVVTAHPDHVPNATTPLAGSYLPGTVDADAARAALHEAGWSPPRLGDACVFEEGIAFVVLAGDADEPAAVRIQGASLRPRPVPLERVAGGSRKRVQGVVPSLRVDALGAKAFGVSRAYFGKGVAAGNVRLDGARAGNSDVVAPGGELWAERLGRVRLVEVGGETKKGNRRVTLEVERP